MGVLGGAITFFSPLREIVPALIAVLVNPSWPTFDTQLNGSKGPRATLPLPEMPGFANSSSVGLT
jgi:hypothetical protein